MKHKFCFLKTAVVVCLLLTLFCGCTAAEKPQREPDAGGEAYRFEDAAGNSFSLPEAPKNVAVLFSSYAEIWNLAGGTIRITVGETVERGFAEKDVLLVDDGAGKTVNHELLLSYRPDFVICSADIAAQRETAAFLSEHGIPAAQFRVESFADYLDVLKIFTEITGNSTAYETYGTAQETQIKALLEQAAAQRGDAAPQKILFVRAGSGYSATKAKTADDNFVCLMLRELGTYNIAENASVLLDGLSLEEILSEDPDHIFFSFMGKEAAARAYVETLLQDPAWQTLRAVQNGSYTFLPKELFHFKPNVKWAEAYRYLAGILYPDLTVS